MKNKILFLFILLLVISFVYNFYLERRLCVTISKIQTENIRSLEHHSNKNFYQYGIENIGKNLQQELLEMKIDQCRLNVRKDLFYIFQDKVVYIGNDKKCLMIKVGYHFYGALFYIKGFQNI
ncbi:hypothetical protein [Chryseobacterium mucoviscidosis]|uniref:Uncharacterized protein n=1 Tax=Chryseobacterium mucoviscidosis TaxID=1945581 RepID=A0A202CA83_9FLAO|nr:hypothetical protein [Chryseobacterium mucoviscidosis]OVE60717.1 hypothetical protein B0E34_03735 [Chryseobacterium mucoviscidosis]